MFLPMLTPSRLRLLRFLTPLVLLSVPLVAMEFTKEVNWDAFDFLIMGTLLYLCVGTYELLSRFHGSRAYKSGLVVVIVGSFMLTWINLAVGIIGNESNDLNMLFFLVPVVGLVLATWRKFSPHAMVFAVRGMMATQVGIMLVALAYGTIIVPLTIFFVGVWWFAQRLFKASSAPLEDKPTSIAI